MAIEEDIFTALDDHAGLTALIASRIYPIKAKQSPTYPYVVYKGISDNQINTLSGGGGRANKRFQMDVYANTYSDVRAVADQVELAMSTSSVINIMLSRIDVDFDADSDKYRVILDFSVWYS